MSIIPVNYGEAAFVHTGAGIEGEAVVTMGFANEVAASAQDLALSIGLLWANVVEGTMVSQITFTSCKVKLGPNSTGDFAEAPFSIIGDQGSDPSTPQSAFLVAKVTGVGGRSGRGRCYLPGAPDLTDSDTGEWDPAFVTQVNGVMAQFLADMDANDTRVELLHNEPGFPFPVTAFIARSRTGTQRRRNRR